MKSTEIPDPYDQYLEPLEKTPELASLELGGGGVHRWASEGVLNPLKIICRVLWVTALLHNSGERS